MAQEQEEDYIPELIDTSKYELEVKYNPEDDIIKGKPKVPVTIITGYLGSGKS